jgi:hypothetical protein
MANNLDTQEVSQNTNLNYIQANTGLAQAIAAISGLGLITVTVADIDLTTGSDQDTASNLYKALRNVFFVLSGAMTGARNIIVPDNVKLYIFKHEATGGFNATVKTAAGTGIALANGDTKILYCDGTNVRVVSAS